MAKKQREALSKEGIIAKLASLRVEINAKVDARNETESATELAKIEEAIKNLIKEYNGYSHDLVLLNHLGSPNCIRELCELRKYDTLSTKTTKDASGFRRMSVEDSKGDIDLTEINNVKVTAPWLYKAQLFALWITGETCAQLEIDGMIDSEKFFKDLTRFFKISDEAKAAAAESGSPSNRAVLEVLRGCVSAMIGEEQGTRVIMAHKRFIDCGLTNVRRNGETGRVRFAKVGDIIALVADVCHMILTNKKVQADISKSLNKSGKEWQQSGFKPVEEPKPIVEVKIEDAPAPADKPETPAPAVSKKKSGAKAKSEKASKPRTKSAPKASTK